MKEDRLDQVFRNSLSEYRSDIDTHESWEELEPFLEKKNRKRRAMVLFFASVSLAIVIGAAMYYSDYNEHLTDLSTISLPIELIESTDQGKTTELSSKVHQHENIEENTTTSNRNTIVTHEDKPSRVIINEQSLATPNTIVVNDVLDEKMTSPLTNNRLSDNYSDIDKQKNNIVDHGNNFKEVSKENSTPLPARSLNDLTKKTINEDGQSNFSVNSLLRVIEPLIVPTTNEYVIPEMNEIPLDQSEETYTQQKEKWALGIRVGSGFWDHNFSSASSDLDPQLLSPLETFQIAVVTEYSVTNSININTGFEYQLLTEIFQHNYTTNVSRDVDGIQTITINPLTGDSTFVTGLITQEGTAIRSIRNHNTYRNWNLPIGISYSVGKSKILLRPEVGVVLNLSSTKIGRELVAGEVVNSQESEIYKSRLGLLTYIQPSLQVEISESSFLRLQPKTSISLNNWANQSLVLKPIIFTFDISFVQKI